MTLNEFLAHLEKTPRTWYLNEKLTYYRRPNGLIRASNRYDQCPITAVVEHCIQGDWHTGTGLSQEVRRDIILAADGHPGNANIVEVRKRILAACGLSRKTSDQGPVA